MTAAALGCLLAAMGPWRSRALVSVALFAWALVMLPTFAAASSLRWTAGRDASAGDLIEVACPTAGLCVAVNNAGGVVVSTHPSPAASNWHVVRGLRVLQLGGTVAQQTAAAQIDTMAYDLSCPSAHLCVIGAAGAEQPDHVPGLPGVASVVYSTNPAGGAATWHTVSGIDGNAGQIDSLTCSSTHLCHALEDITDSDGDVTAIPLVTHNPTGGARGWMRTGGTVADYTEGLACPTSAVCVTASGLGVYSSANALGPASGWHFASDTNQTGQIDSVACPSTHLCLAAPDEAGCIPCGAGNDLISTHPAAGIWRRAAVPTGDLACPTATFCVGIAQGTHHTRQDLVFSTDPAGPAGAWHYLAGLSGSHPLRALACASTSLCVSVGDSGEIAVGHAG
jgi:hypothetical protein